MSTRRRGRGEGSIVQRATVVDALRDETNRS